jgi:iron complex transport system ATP-binding protein
VEEFIAAENVSFAYAEAPPAVCGVSLRIERGRVMGIIGPNGSGKSTLLRLLAGIVTPHTGQITLDGAEVHRLSPRARAQRLAYLPQSVAPLFGLTVEDTVALGRFPHLTGLGGLAPRDMVAVEQAMARTQVLALRTRIFTELSGGERQRVLLASVLAQGPAFLLLDEPTAALDLHHEAEVFALLRALAGEGFGVCVVTHDLSLAAGHCDGLLLLSEHGAPIARGLPPDVLTAEALSAAYGAPVRVGMHPFTGAPLPYVSPGALS